MSTYAAILVLPIITFSNSFSIPCSSIFCQFWLCEEAQCVYLRIRLGSISISDISLLVYKNAFDF